MRNLLKLLNVPISIPHLVDVLENMVSSDELKKYTRVFKTTTPLQVEITTFAYKNGIPANTKGHGGGYVFDCRCLHNPGKYERFKTLDGRDEEVMKFLKDDGEADDYMHNIQQIVDLTIDKYLSRGFTSLQLSLGCTGGQHRSVFCAEELLKHIMEKYPDQVDCQLTHRELQNRDTS
jgi:RNase adaptor protein for sRNA GlmZ degradation